MNCEVKKLNATKFSLNVTIARGDLKEKEEEVFKTLNNLVTVPGFRKGKAPFDVFIKNHKNTFEDELVKKCIPFYCEEAVKQNNFEVIDYPMIKDIHLTKDGLTFTAEIEVKPDVPVEEKTYKNIPVAVADSEIKDKEVDKVVENIQHLINEFMPGKLTNDEYAQFSGYPHEARLREVLKTELTLEKVRHNRTLAEDKIIQHLLDNVSFSVPESIAHKQAERLLAQELNNLRSRGVSEEEANKNKEEIRKKVAPLAEKQVKIYYIMEKIIALEQVKTDKVKDVYNVGMGLILRYAQWKV